MDWIFDNLQIVVIVVLALGSWLSSRMEAKKKQAEEVEDDDEIFEPEPRRQPSVPPPLDRRMLPPELPVFAEERANESAAILKHQQDLEERLRQIRETKATTSGGASATRSRLAAKGKPVTPAPAALLSIRASVRSRKEVRRNIVMREVLGSPVGLR